MKTKTRLSLGFGGQILLAAILGIYMLFGLADVKQQFNFVVKHDVPVIANARHLSKLVVDMETGQRGFCIVQKEEFLEPYIAGVKKFKALIEKEKKLVSDNPGQVESLEQIEHLVHEWQEKAANPEIAIARKVALGTIDAQQLQDILRRGVGKELMDRIMALGHEIETSFSGRGDWEGAFAVEVIEKCMADREDGQRGFLITGKEEFLKKYTAGEQKKLPEYFARLRAIVSERGRGDELSKKIDQLEQLTHEWVKKAAEPEIAARREMNESPESLKDVAALLEAGTGKALLDEVRKKLDRFIKIEEELTARRYDSATETAAKTRNIAVTLLAIALFFGGTIAVVTSRAISNPLAKLARGAEKVGSGALDTRVDVGSSDEIGDLARVFNNMTRSLREVSSMRKQAEEGLKMFHKFAETSGEGLGWADLDGNVEYMNQALCDMMGEEKPEDTFGRPVLQYYDEETQHRLKNEIFPEVLEKGFWRGELDIHNTRGNVIPTLNTLSALTDAAGNPNYFANVVTNISELKQAEKAMQESEERLDALFSSVHTGIIVIDAESHTIIDANPYAVSHIGVSTDKITGKVCHKYICPAEEGKCPITDLGQTVVSSESILLNIDGEKIPILKSVTALYMDDKKYLIESFVDISENKKAEEEKKRLEAQLQQAQKLESVGILAGGIAHDFNNLLSIIMGNISMTKDDVKPEYGVTEFLNEAEKASLLARDLTKQLITFSKGGAPVKKLSYISNLIEKAADFALSGSAVGCEFNTPDDLWPVEIDEGQIRQVINNVVTNAVQAMPKGGAIEVYTKNILSGTDKEYEGLSLQDGNYVKISIQDQGTGISDKYLPMIFDPYFSSKERGTKKGMGLGLATSYSIIKQHNGEIAAESKLGVGTTINIYLPASEIEVPVKKKLEEKVIVGKGKILIMDDEEMIRGVLSQMLRRLGYEVESSKDGTEAIESYRKAMKSDNPFDAVMLDLTVRGGMGGKDAIQKLIEIDPDVNGIVNSGHSEDPVMTDFEKYAFCSAIAKPFSMPELSVILDKVITDGESAGMS